MFTLSNLPSNSILLSYTILIIATNSQFEKFGQRFGFVVSSTGAIAVSSYELNITNNDILLVGIKLFQIISIRSNNL